MHKARFLAVVAVVIALRFSVPRRPLYAERVSWGFYPMLANSCSFVSRAFSWFNQPNAIPVFHDVIARAVHVPISLCV